MRIWDLARAAKAEKVGFGADIGAYFFIFWIGGGARLARGLVRRRWGSWRRSFEKNDAVSVPKDYVQLADERQRPHRGKKVWAAFTPARSVARFARNFIGTF
jgi:hypothetical protein